MKKQLNVLKKILSIKEEEEIYDEKGGTERNENEVNIGIGEEEQGEVEESVTVAEKVPLREEI